MRVNLLLSAPTHQQNMEHSIPLKHYVHKGGIFEDTRKWNLPLPRSEAQEAWAMGKRMELDHFLRKTEKDM